MEIFGLHEYIKDVTRRLAKLGAFAVAPDYYFRKGVDLTKITDIPQLLPIVNSKPDAELLSDLDATVAWAKSQGGDTSRLGIIGFCRGGRTVWEYAAHNSDLKAGVAFYGPPVDPPNPLWPKSPTQLAPDMKAPVLGLYGEADTGIPVGTGRGAESRARGEPARRPSSRSIPARRTASTPTIAQATARKPPRTRWNQMQAWFKKYKVLELSRLSTCRRRAAFSARLFASKQSLCRSRSGCDATWTHLLDLPDHPHKAMPRPTTTPRNNNVRPGAVRETCESIHR